MKEICIILSYIWIGFMSVKLYIDLIRPTLIKKSTKEIEKNPKWLVSALRSGYYGLDDIDIILIENCRFSILPYVRLSKKTKRLEFLIPNDMVTTNNIDDIAKILLIGKICIKTSPRIGILYSNKPTYWLSILNYMLDGGNINQSAVSWKEK